MKLKMTPRGAVLLTICALTGAGAWNWAAPEPVHAQSVVLGGAYSLVLETQMASGATVVNVPAIGQFTRSERTADGLVVRQVKGTYTSDSSGMGRLALSYDVPGADSEGVAATDPLTRDNGMAIDGLRSDAGPIERVTLRRQ